MNTILEQALKLPVRERIELIGDIWDSISDEPEAFELTDEQKAELERRIEHHRLKPEDTVPWETVEAKALAR